jgi:hypothetical protein
LALAAISAERLNPLVAYELIFDVLVVIRPKKNCASTGGILSPRCIGRHLVECLEIDTLCELEPRVLP